VCLLCGVQWLNKHESVKKDLDAEVQAVLQDAKDDTGTLLRDHSSTKAEINRFQNAHVSCSRVYYLLFQLKSPCSVNIDSSSLWSAFSYIAAQHSVIYTYPPGWLVQAQMTLPPPAAIDPSAGAGVAIKLVSSAAASGKQGSSAMQTGGDENVNPAPQSTAGVNTDISAGGAGGHPGVPAMQSGRSGKDVKMAVASQPTQQNLEIVVQLAKLSGAAEAPQAQPVAAPQPAPQHAGENLEKHSDTVRVLPLLSVLQSVPACYP
jgi:hypothetical protein